MPMSIPTCIWPSACSGHAICYPSGDSHLCTIPAEPQTISAEETDIQLLAIRLEKKQHEHEQRKQEEQRLALEARELDALRQRRSRGPIRVGQPYYSRILRQATLLLFDKVQA